MNNNRISDCNIFSERSTLGRNLVFVCTGDKGFDRSRFSFLPGADRCIVFFHHGKKMMIVLDLSKGIFQFKMKYYLYLIVLAWRRQGEKGSSKNK